MIVWMTPLWSKLQNFPWPTFELHLHEETFYGLTWASWDKKREIQNIRQSTLTSLFDDSFSPGCGQRWYAELDGNVEVDDWSRARLKGTCQEGESKVIIKYPKLVSTIFRSPTSGRYRAPAFAGIIQVIILSVILIICVRYNEDGWPIELDHLTMLLLLPEIILSLPENQLLGVSTRSVPPGRAWATL